MTEKDGDWTYYTGWIAAFALLAIFFAVCVFMGWFDQPWCEVNKSGAICFREWLSALGGWAALLVGGPTLYFLWRQVRDADRNQRITFKIQLRRSKSLARKVSRNAELIVQYNEFVARTFILPVAREKAEMALEVYDIILADFRRHLEAGGFQQFEDEIEGDLKRPLATIFEFMKLSSEGEHSSGADPERRALGLGLLLDRVADYSKECMMHANAFLEEVAEIVGETDDVDHIENAPSTDASSFSS